MLIGKSGRNVAFRGQSGCWKGGLGLGIVVKVFGFFFAAPKKRGQKKGAIAAGLFAKRASAFWEMPWRFGEIPCPFRLKGETRDGIPLFCSFFFAAPKKNEPKRRGLRAGKELAASAAAQTASPETVGGAAPYPLANTLGPFTKREKRGMEIPLVCSFFFAAPKKNEPKRRGLFPRSRGTKGQGTVKQMNPNGRQGRTSQNNFAMELYIRMRFAERPIHGGEVFCDFPFIEMDARLHGNECKIIGKRMQDFA